MHRHKTFFACGSFAPVRFECECDAAPWLAGTLEAPSLQGNRLPQELRPYWGLFLSLFKPRGWSPEGLFGQSFSIGPPVQALRGCPCLGVLLCCSACQAHRRGPLAVVLLCRSARQSLKGAPWVKSCSVVQCVRCLMGQPLYCSAAQCWRVGRERLW